MGAAGVPPRPSRRGRLRQVISLRLDDALYDRLIRMAARRARRDVSVLMRELLEEGADRADSRSAKGCDVT